MAGGTLHYGIMGDIDRVQGSVYMVWALLHYSLETRRLRGDLIEVFKMFKGFDNIALNDFFKLSSTTLRGPGQATHSKSTNHMCIWMLRNFFHS